MSVCVCVPGGLADGEDEGGQLHRVLHARRHASEGERVHHEGVQIRSQVTHRDRVTARAGPDRVVLGDLTLSLSLSAPCVSAGS